MLSGTAAGAAKPIRTVALEACPSDWLRAGDSHDVQGASFRALNNRTNTRLQPMSARCDVLVIASQPRGERTESIQLDIGVHTRFLEGRGPAMARAYSPR